MGRARKLVIPESFTWSVAVRLACGDREQIIRLRHDADHRNAGLVDEPFRIICSNGWRTLINRGSQNWRSDEIPVEHRFAVSLHVEGMNCIRIRHQESTDLRKAPCEQMGHGVRSTLA